MLRIVGVIAYGSFHYLVATWIERVVGRQPDVVDTILFNYPDEHQACCVCAEFATEEFFVYELVEIEFGFAAYNFTDSKRVVTEPEDTEGNERFHVVYYVLAYEFVVAVITASIHRNGYRFEIFAIDRVFEYPVDGSGSGSSRVDAHCFVHIELVESGFVNN